MVDTYLETLQVARDTYDKYIETGLAMHPPFKGFAIEHIWFAMDEPELYKTLFLRGKIFDSVDEIIEYEGHKEQILDAIEGTFKCNREQSYVLYKSLWPLLFGLASIAVNKTFNLTIEQASTVLGVNLRAHLLSIKSGQDERSSFVPSSQNGPDGKVEEYIDKGMHQIARKNNDIMLHTLIGQNRLLKALHASPSYVRDNEWVELDRLVQGGFGFSRRSLGEKYPSLTDGDIRIIILDKLGFSVGVSAVLLGISPASVTKARQRLKGKLNIESVDEFVADL